METIMPKLIWAKRHSCPLIAINTCDQTATIKALVSALRETNAFSDVSIVTWDIINGIKPVDTISQPAVQPFAQQDTTEPVGALMASCALPEGAVVIMRNAHRVVGDFATMQAISLLRDRFKPNGRTLVLLHPLINLPVEIRQDFIILTESAPSDEQIDSIIESNLFTAVEQIDGFVSPTDNEKSIMRRALCGVESAGAAEQAVALSVTKDGIDLPSLWEQKKQMVSAIKGLSIVDNPIDCYENIGGLSCIKTFLSRLMHGKRPPSGIIFIDEIEKMLGGHSTDSSGVSQGFLGRLLTDMTEANDRGIMFVSPAGCGKSAVAKAAGKEGGIPTIFFDLAGMKASLVGESEQNLSSALKVKNAICKGSALVIATCNGLATLPPELRRRFNLGTFFFDLPDASEREAIWKIWRKIFQISDDVQPSDEGWNGANIRDCCNIADSLSCSLAEASQYVVPIGLAAREEIDALRRQASGRFISASHNGVYAYAAECGKALPQRAFSI